MNEKMGDMTELIVEYAALQRDIVMILEAVETDGTIREATRQYDALTTELAFLKEPFEKGIQEAETRQNEIKEELKTAWVTEDKTFKCAAGIATLRATRSLKIRDKNELIIQLGKLLGNDLEKVTECITGFNLKKIRQYKDAGLIDGGAAYYESKQTVSVTGKSLEENQIELPVAGRG